MKKTFAVLLRMSRPYYIIQAIAPPIAGYVSTPQMNFSLLTVATVGTVFGLLAIAAWSGNDFIDNDSDSRGRQKTFHGLYVAGGTGIRPKQRLRTWVITTYMMVLLVAALGLAATISMSFLVLASVCGLVGIFYSLPPIRLKTKGLIGAMLMASSYGLVAFTAGCVASVGQISISSLAFGTIMSVLVFGYDGLGHIIDYEDDKMNGLNTFAVQLGLPRAARILAVCQVLPVLILGGLGHAGFLKINLVGTLIMFAITAFTAIFFLYSRSEQYLWALRLVSVPLLSASFFLLL